MRRIVITGGAGFIGTNLAQHYLEQGDHVTIYDTLGRNGSIDNVLWLRQHRNAESLSVLVGDIRMLTPPFHEAIEQADALIHLASQVAVTTSVADPVYDFEVNASGTFNILEAVRRSTGKRPAVLFSSTNKVYGGMETVKVVEEDHRYRYLELADGIAEHHLLDFHSPYGCSKGAADQYVRDYARIYDLRTVVFRQSCIYGPRQFGIEDQGWVAWFIIAAMLGRPITVYGNGKQVRDVLFVTDLVNAYEQALLQIDRTSGGIYNVGGGPRNTVSLLELIDVLKRDVNPSLEVTYADWRPGDQPVYVSDIRKADVEFGWSPTTTWEQGVTCLIEWVRQNRAMLEKMF